MRTPANEIEHKMHAHIQHIKENAGKKTENLNFVSHKMKIDENI